MVNEPMTLEFPTPEAQPLASPAKTVPLVDGPLRRTRLVITKVSVVIPVYNEEATIQDLVKLVVDAPMPRGLAREIIIVNDCSTDGTGARLDQLKEIFPETEIRVFHK